MILIKNIGYTIPLILYAIDRSLDIIFGAFGHSTLKVIFPKPLSYIYMSPCLHWIHHSINPKHFGKNLSMKYVFWDKIMGTYLDESNLKDINMGLKIPAQYNKYNPFYSYYILPWKKKFLKDLNTSYSIKYINKYFSIFMIINDLYKENNLPNIFNLNSNDFLINLAPDHSLIIVAFYYNFLMLFISSSKLKMVLNF